jgi:hypothetical protein
MVTDDAAPRPCGSSLTRENAQEGSRDTLNRTRLVTCESSDVPQVLTAARAVLYFGARGDAGLTRALIVLSLEIVAAVVVGLLIADWYDHKRLYRLSPDLIAYVSRVTDERLAAAHPPVTSASS